MLHHHMSSPMYMEPMRCAPPPSDDPHDDVNEALLLAETEELLNCLEPAAFDMSSSLSSSTPPPSTTHSSGSAATLHKITIPSAAPAEKKPAQRRGRRSWKPDAARNPSRERLMVELATLRQQAGELETELTVARAHRDELERNKLLLLPTWERIAKRQHRARDKSEDENRRLKFMVESQRVFVTQLQHAWHRWQKMTSLNPYAGVAYTSVRFNENDPALFDVLAADLDVEYMRLSHVFQDAGLLRGKLDVSSNSTTKTRQLSNGLVVPYLEMSVVEVEPYELGMLMHVTWECMWGPHSQHNKLYYEGVQMPERTGAMKMRVTTVHDDREAALEMLTVTRRYVEKDRTTYVWRSITRLDDGDGELSDAFTEETGWIVMQDMAAIPDCPYSGGTMTLTCLHLEPKRQQASPPVNIQETIEKDRLMNLVVNNFQADFQKMNDMIEDRMLQTSSES